MDVIRPWHVPVRPRPGRTALPAFAALERVRDVLTGEGPDRWGPGGGVAYELVTGIATVHLGSDLDLVFVAAEPLDRGRMRRLAEGLRTAGQGVRIDVQVQTPAGGFALEEWLRVGDGGPVALKTGDGPRLAMDLWTVNPPRTETRAVA